MKKVLLFCTAMIALFAPRSFAQPGTATRIAGVESSIGYNGEGIIDMLAGFNDIQGFCKDTIGNTYIVDQFRIRKIDAATHLVTTIAGTGARGYTGDGGPGVLAKIRNVHGIGVDHSGNVLIADSNVIRQINGTTGTISTIAGGGSSFADGSLASASRLSVLKTLYIDRDDNIYAGMATMVRRIDGITHLISTVVGTAGDASNSGDGGLANIATISGPDGITKDLAGNLYIKCGASGVIRKIDPSGIISTIAGNNPTNSGDGGYAVNAHIGGGSTSFDNIAADSSGNLFFLDHIGSVDYNNWPVVRKIDAATGIINKVAGGLWYGADPLFFANYFMRDNNGTILFCNSHSIYRLSHTYTAIKSITKTDTFFNPCSIPSITSHAATVYVNGIPAAGEVAHLRYNLGDTTIDMTAPYYPTIDSLGATVYAFNFFNLHGYTYPGDYTSMLQITTLNGYQDIAIFPVMHASSACDTGITLIGITSITDTVTTPPCVFPAMTRSIVTGFVTGTVTPYDSVYIRYFNDDSTVGIMVATIDPVRVPIISSLSGGDLGDSMNVFTYTYLHPYVPQEYYTSIGIPTPYWRSVEAKTNNGLLTDQNTSAGSWFSGFFPPNGFPGYIQIENCDHGSVEGEVILGAPAGSSSCPFNVPYTPTLSGQLYFHGSAASMTSIPMHIDFNDGSDTTIIISHLQTIGDGLYYYDMPPINHTYTIPGTYRVTTTFDTSLHLYNASYSLAITLTSSCSPADGTFYVDANHNCTADMGETRLAYWPFLLVDNTTGDTTNQWCDGAGNYHLSLANSDTYTILSVHSDYGTPGSHYTLAPSCPSTGSATVVAGPGISFTQNFGFDITSTTSTGRADMSVSGWGWGFVPGDTGIISIWSSDAWGYTGDTLSSTITLTIDTNLSYIGMWNGPTPTTVVGNVLTWTFSTTASLFDFTANVKVMCDTTAMMGDTAHNVLYVSPTALPDTNLANNTYAWSEPIRSSWDPNEKEVSPKGFGPEGYIENGTPLSYMIHFQNSGTAPASNIKVIDTISANLDLSTLQIVNSSAPVLVYQTGPNTVQFRFNDINLPDSMSDPTGSVGYVAFNILPIDNLAPGTQITNKAGIIFDYNAPVYTNSTINTIEDSTRMITGDDHVCAGFTLTLADALPGGVWSATNNHATVTGGIVTGITAGVDTIRYTMYGNKVVSKVITVLSSTGAGTIIGTPTVCEAATTTLTNAVTGGTWTSSDAAATVAGGVVSGVSTGTTIISYTVTNSCGTATDTMMVTVNPLPHAGVVTGTLTVCEAATTTLTSTVTGGTWISGTGVTVAGGVVTGVTAGIASVVYTVSNSCGSSADTMMVTVNPAPQAGTITGTPTVCEGATTTLANTSTGGTWTSSTAAGTVTGGVVTAATAGTTIISYTVTNSCGTATDTMMVTVNPLPHAGVVTGTLTVCEGATTTLTSTVTGGTWISGTGVTVTGGVVTGVTAGIAPVVYTVSNSCGSSADTMMVTVNPAPQAGTITGAATVCEGATTTLANTTTGGTWASSTAAGTVAGGVVTAGTAGTTIISYSVTNSCGTAIDTMMVTVNPLPYAGIVTGTLTVCEGATTTLTSTVTGGTWISGTGVTVTGGVVTGVTAGIAPVVYTVSNSCGSSADTMMVTVNPLPNAGTIAGATNVCETATITLTDTATGGSWTSTSSSATIVGGVVTGATAGTAVISYTVTNSCGTATDTLMMTITAIPATGAITGTTSLCVSGSATLANAETGGTWSTTNGSASISATGTVTAVTPGTDTVVYIVSNACGADTATTIVTTTAMPVAGTILGADSVCEGASAVLTESATGGLWSTSNGSVMTISTGGTITAVAPGVVTISYAVTNSCGTATASYTVNVLSTADCNAGVATAPTQELISIYPNPTNGSFTVALPQQTNNATITMTDVSGKVIDIIKPAANQLLVPISLTNLASGTYLIKVEADGKTYRDKVVLW